MAKLRAGEPFPVGDKPRRRFVIGRKKAHVRLSAGAHKKNRMGSGSSEPAMSPPPQESRARPESAVSAPGIVAVEDTDALDCGVCFLPLKPPIFQDSQRQSATEFCPKNILLDVIMVYSAIGRKKKL
ncbi:hypothetical protein PR202_ga11291 [Eleusine coracana subsp. coracana]|uniref:Uncharacterized protein n=1 Tax=Eleusine coracana subsp. coracana TaxID=191504 RepID=A0AAV5C982_ELECO|nr:hypothetical protein PR202_ga11291 [Eleusine coracana subsp. coracana]